MICGCGWGRGRRRGRVCEKRRGSVELAALGFDAAVMEIGEGKRDEDAGNKDSGEGALHKFVCGNFASINFDWNSVKLGSAGKISAEYGSIRVAD